MTSGPARYFVPYAIGLAPALLAALTWSPSGEWTRVELLLRNYDAPLIAAEVFTIIIAAREGALKVLRAWNWSRPALTAAALLLGIALITAILAPLQYVALVHTAYWILHALFGVSIVYLCGLIFEPRDLVRAYLVGFGAMALLFAIFLLQIPDWNRFNWRSGLMAFNHIRYAGTYLGPIAAISVGVMAIAERRPEWIGALAVACCSVGMALWTGSRGAVVAVVAAMVAALLLAPAMRSFRGWGGGLASILVAVAIASQAPAATDPMLGVKRTVEATTRAEPTTGRIAMWGTALDAIGEKPVFGYGEGQMREVAPFSDMAQPHNVVLQVAMAWGVVGLLCVMVLALSFARRALPAVRKDPVLLPPFIGMAAVGVMSLYDGSLFAALPTSIFVACAALIVARWGPSRRAAVESASDRTALA
jgi:O-antigen ligase